MRRILAASALLAITGGAQAATATTTFGVNVSVVDVCTVTAADLAFPTYDPTAGTLLNGTGTITVKCTLGTAYNVRLDEGANGAAVTSRQMIRTLGTEEINYALYRNAGRTQNWGETDGTDTVAGLGLGVGLPIIVYGQIPASENVPVGDYTDTVNVTVNY